MSGAKCERGIIGEQRQRGWGTSPLGSWGVLAAAICVIMMCGQAVACHCMEIYSFKASRWKSGGFVSGALTVCQSTFWVQVRWSSAGGEDYDHWLDNWIVEIYRGTEKILEDNDVPWDVKRDDSCTGSDKVGVFEIDASGWEPGAYQLTAKVRRDAGEPPNTWKESEGCTIIVIKVNLNIEGVDDEDEVSVGEVVVKKDYVNDNSAPRKKIILEKIVPSTCGANAVLSRNNTKVRVFDAATGGNEVTFSGADNVFANSSLPKPLWVQGHTASTTMRDVELKLEALGVGCPDQVRFTVLWVAVSSDHGGIAELDNSARTMYGAQIVPPPNYNLGQHLFCAPTMLREGRASEFLGSVSPLDFVPSQFSSASSPLRLRRDRQGDMIYWGPNGNENSYQPYADGDDTSPDQLRDDDPQSGASNGVIYDIDCPSITIWGLATNSIVRHRCNFKEWADWDGTRCSTKDEWYTAQSYKKTGSWDSGTSTGVGSKTLSDSGKSWTTNMWSPGGVKTMSAPYPTNEVVSNTGTTLTCRDTWSPMPSVGCKYEVINTSTWTVVNDVGGDNQNADGQIQTTWNLE